MFQRRLVIGGVALAVAVLSLGWGCKRSTAAQAAEATPPGAENYRVTVKAPSSIKVGETAVAQVALVPQQGYKVNLEYPTKLTVSGPKAASPSSQVLRKKDAKRFDKSMALFTPSAKITAAGKHRFTAELAFSVCTDQECQLKTAKINWTAAAK
ncbi:MAG: hypothetical protein H6707_08180 [Deltaproteobacteria bacterium]|nr:hypothetical protein [Deltaproteobacteria bacterium]